MRAVEREQTQQIFMSYLPPLGAVQELVARHRGMEVRFYNSYAKDSEPWLIVGLPGGRSVALRDCHELHVLESVLARVMSAMPHVVCPKCRYAVPRTTRPHGDMRCPRCYRARRDFTPMVWDGVEGFGRVVRSIAGHAI